jgi:hypothetical protein
MSTLLKTSTGLSVRIHDLPGRPPFMTAPELADAYGVPTKHLTRAVRRNPERFPEDFAFQLTPAEAHVLRDRRAIPPRANRALPWGFTHAGALMVGAMLRNPQAVAMSIEAHRGIGGVYPEAPAAPAAKAEPPMQVQSAWSQRLVAAALILIAAILVGVVLHG